MTYERRGTALVNSELEFATAVAAASKVVGETSVITDLTPVTAAEDFAIFLQECPGTFMFIGQGAGGATSQPPHTPTYDFNDAVIPLGVNYWLSIVAQELGENNLAD